MSEPNSDRELGKDPKTAAARARRRARVFGDVLPESTGDDRDTGAREHAGADRSDEWLRGQVPPHHD